MKQRIVTTLALCGALAVPTLASANSTWHQTNTEIGYSIAPDHATGGKTGEQVANELAAAKADKRQWFFLTYNNLAKPGWAKQGTSRTRADALAEVEAMTPAERARLDAIYTPG
ncbi:DUF4148 domain-containing protein [Achromobacter xylosoxidans]|uniref:DUF4148 domain-containing protein n=1 Tax=Alcaligenes xylosoxydans xylosoxydans TaxID=85698 RepID=UPI0015674B62|nr:DUF4148 domain-containing protein [Achromobacter xylosoxidans]QKI75983.1 DUF4148 domain-containing protein [Achromobacter xylosoxidans]